MVVKILHCDFYDFWWGNGPAGSVVLPARWWNTLYILIRVWPIIGSCSTKILALILMFIGLAPTVDTSVRRDMCKFLKYRASSTYARSSTIRA